ncbi:MAG: hypothetical protein COB02_12310 [Candidatus Cloacimonadota bacterium]|nr:MAG: hypothetical protein COB02_12310 [Candidatus Cloacimonadota bacterium]
MSDSLARITEMQAQEAAERNHLSFRTKMKDEDYKEKDFTQILQQSAVYQGMGERPAKDNLGENERILLFLFRIMDEIQVLNQYVGLKPELIKIEEARLYYPEIPSPITIRNYRCQGKNLPYIKKINGSLWVDTKKYETYRKTKLAI